MAIIERPLIIEQTSASENHYEFEALLNTLSNGFGLDQEKPYLQSIRDELHLIRVLMERSFELSELMRLEAQKILDAHAHSAQEYIRQIEEPVPEDYYPFVLMPVGTSVRDLADGGRLFVFSDGTFLRVSADGKMSVIDENGMAVSVESAIGGKIILPDGRELTLIADAVKVTHEAAGIEGLPDGIKPQVASEGRYSILLPDGTRMEVYQSEKSAAIINTSGTIDVLGISRIYGIGEEVQSRTITGGAKSFKALESRHAGMIEAGGTIHLSLSSGNDLVIHFPDDGGSDNGGDDRGAVCFNCVEPE